MPIDFVLTPQQVQMRREAREFAREVLLPVSMESERQRDPHQAFLCTRSAYREAYKRKLATSFLPRQYGGGGMSHVDFVLVAEELCAVDPGFVTSILVNGLALMPIYWYGDERQKERWLGQATSSTSGDFLAGWVLSERGGSANFDHPHSAAGLQLMAAQDKRNGEYVLNGEKHWPCNAGGWDLQGADVNLCVARIDASSGGTQCLGAFIVERGTPGVSYEVIDKFAHRSCQNVTMTFRNVRVPQSCALAKGDGDLLISRNFSWSGPLAAIASVGVARAAYEFTLEWAKTYTGGGTAPIISSPVVGSLLVDIAARIEAARYFCWKAANYIDHHEGAAHALAAMNKTYVSESMLQVVLDCMRVVGVNALDRRFPLEKLYREAVVFPLYDAGNIGMQRRRAWGVMNDGRFRADMFVEGAALPFEKSMHGLGYVGSPTGFRP